MMTCVMVDGTVCAKLWKNNGIITHRVINRAGRTCLITGAIVIESEGSVAAGRLDVHTSI